MGKRQMGELQPFEFAITLVAAELACIPMADHTIPIIYGIIPVFTLFLVHLLITKMGVASIKFRKILNGSPAIVIDKGNILNAQMKKLDMDANDLLAALRESGYFSPGEVECAIVETDGTLTVMPKFANKPVTNADMNIVGGTAEIPVTLIVEGKWMECNYKAAEAKITREQLEKILQNLKLKQQDIFLLLLTGENVFIQPIQGSSVNRSIQELSEKQFAIETNAQQSAKPELN